GVDTGPVLLKRTITIAEDDTTGSLTGKLALLGANALLEALPLWIAGDLKPQPQDERQASYTRMLRKEDGEIAWNRAAAVIAREVRAYSPWPGSYTIWRGKLLKIVAAHAWATGAEEMEKNMPAGTVMRHREAGETSIQVVTGAGMLAIDSLQLEGKKAMSAEEFLRGYQQIVGDLLGNP
ncbi:MAG TPA: hypothetical protein VKR83_01140, partial [Ktedonobacteraceae bacterium]|nr:hypothetical protein [Ktedonobacteraceae bacterium]